jgi:redox-sensitive bicupin YhaK (pirin superfamily)
MIRIRPAAERGHFDHGWLDTRHTFSFSGYYDPQHMGFRALRVINEDWLQPGQGFDTHPHRDMEIVTLVLEGALAHRDSLGHGSVIRPGEFQRMTAGTGIAHSELNASPDEPVHLYQIWLQPGRKGLEPSYEQRAFAREETRGRWRLVASPDGRDGALTIRQDADVSLCVLEDGEDVAYPLRPARHAWLQVLRGAVDLDGHRLEAGDGAALSDEPALTLRADGPAELLLFDLA